MTTTDLAALGTAGFAAVAAGASWASVWQTRRNWRDQQTPQITPSWTEPNNRVTLSFTNTGGGFATQTNFIVVSGRECCTGVVPPVTLGPGIRVTLDTDITPLGALHEVTGAVFCLDRLGTWHAWSWAGDHERPRKDRRPAKSLSPEDALQLFHPDIDIESLVFRKWRVVPSG
jgi:hypothetical protein